MCIYIYTYTYAAQDFSVARGKKQILLQPPLPTLRHIEHFRSSLPMEFWVEAAENEDAEQKTEDRADTEQDPARLSGDWVSLMF